MKSFELVEPATIDEAVALLEPDDPGVRAIAGATALVPMMKARLFQPTRLVSLRRLDGALRGVHEHEGGLRLGALATLTELERSSRVRAVAPVMSRALRTLSNVRIRNVATLGGHLAHGDPHMDLPPVLMTLGARVRAVSRRGERWIDLNDLVLGYYQTTMAADELIAEVHVPAQPTGARTWYEKFTALSADDWPTVGVAVWYRTDAAGSDTTRPTVMTEARVAVSAATERPVRVPAAESALTGAAPDDATFRKAADAAADAVEPLADLRGSAAYKREMIRVHVRRALERAR
ncbi:MAG: xanthine dehydrogenase family protein subunit M [Acidobacteria bacterium]|nr:xanthine dehydrogenase family protein subunit M [Acidobacteriota bacterium]